MSKVPNVLKKIAIVLAVFTLIGGPLSGVATWANVGLNDSFLSNWWWSFVKSLVVMLPAAWLIMFVVDGFSERYLSAWKGLKRKLISGIIFGFMMQGVVTAVTTASNVGFNPLSDYLSAWAVGFATALPIGVTISIVMTIWIRPRLERIMGQLDR